MSKIYKEAYTAFNIGRGLFEAIPQDERSPHSCAYCALVHAKSCGRYACKKEEREDNQNVSFTKL